MAQWGGVNSVKADPVVVKTPILLSGGKFAESFTSGTYIIQMQGWQQFIAYEDETGVAFNEDSFMQFDLAESVSNGNVRVTFTFSDDTTEERWWCLGIGNSKDDTSTPYNHDFDNSKYWLKKGLDTSFESKKSLKIKKVVVQNFNYDNGSSVVTYQVNGGTLCGESMTIKSGNAKSFGAYGGVFSATATQTNIFQLKNFEVGDYQKIVIKFGAAVPSTGGWKLNNNSGLTGLEGKTIYEFALDGSAISDFTIFNWDANPNPINISEVYFYKELTEIDASPLYEAPANTKDLKDFTGTNASWASSVTYPKTFEHQGQSFGDGNGDAQSTHVTITGYDYINFVVTDATTNGVALRVWIWDGSSVVTLYPHPIADYSTADYSSLYRIEAPGVYTVRVSGYDYLKGVKAENYWGDNNPWTPVTVSLAYANAGAAPVDFVVTSYALSGAETPNASVTAALADVNATYYDATGVIGTGIDFTDVANPNALFKANDGVLANSQNVIVGTTCANLVLADNHPFKAPFDFTATAASYNTTINTTAQAGTLCLPFAATIPAGVDAWTLTYTSGEKATPTPVTTTIPANTPVLLNGSGSKSFTGSSVDVDADATNTSGAMTGVFKQGYVPQNSYVLQYGDEGIGFYKVDAENTIIIKPFRAYLTAQSGGARIFIDFGEDPTGINNVTAKKAEENGAYFNLAGQRVAQPTKGLYIVNGKKVVIK